MKIFSFFIAFLFVTSLGSFAYTDDENSDNDSDNDQAIDNQVNDDEILPFQEPEFQPPQPPKPFQDFMKACKQDIVKFCKDLPPGPQVMECMIKNQSNLSQECSVEVKKMAEHHKKMEAVKAACEADFKKYCKDSHENMKESGPEGMEGHHHGHGGPGMHMKCMKDNFDKFSPACQKAIKELPPPPHM